MAPPKPWIPGDPITAERLNETAAESIRPRREISLGNGSSFVNETMGNQSANMRRPFMKLVEAIDDFEIPYEPTDLDVALDDVPSGMVRQVRLNKRSGEHNKETIGGPFRAWDVLQGLNGEDTKITGDAFYVLYNEDSKRWEVMGQSVGGGAKWIRFIIVSSDPTISSAIVNIRQRSFTGPAYGSVLSDTVIDSVYDTAGCYLNEINVDLTGRSGFAMLMLVDDEAELLHFDGYDAPKWYWMVTGICCPSLSCL